MKRKRANRSTDSLNIDNVRLLRKSKEVTTPDGEGTFVGYCLDNKRRRRAKVRLIDGRIRRYPIQALTVH